jgi:hypothetical protein
MTMSCSKAMLVAGAMVLAGCAGTPAEPTPAPDVRAATDPAATRDNCVRYTGTRIPVPEGQCVVYAGRVYTADEIHRTGAMTMPDALRRLGAY